MGKMSRFFSEETRKKISEALKGSKHPFYGKHHSEETKQKISNTKSGVKCPNRKKLSEENRKKLSEAHKGLISPMLGRHYSREHKQKLSESHKGIKQSEKSKRKRSDALKGKRIGKDNPNWKGGTTSVLMKLRNSIEYNRWRSNVFIRDNFICQKCGSNGGHLEAHHKKPFSKLLKEVRKYLPLLNLYDGAMIYTPLWNIQNGITLCKKCHR